MCQEHLAAIQLGCPEASQKLAGLEAIQLVRTLIFIRVEAGNNGKALEVRLCIYPLCFYTVIHLSSSQISIFLGAAAGPVDHYTIDFFPRAETESHRQFRLRKIAGAAADDPRLRLPVEENADGRADRIAIRFCAL